jgi:hypothetical protein
MPRFLKDVNELVDDSVSEGAKLFVNIRNVFGANAFLSNFIPFLNYFYKLLQE